MSKWDKILGGQKATGDLGGVVTHETQTTFISISMLVLFVAVAIFFVFKAKQGLNTTVIKEVGTVITKNAEVAVEKVIEPILKIEPQEAREVPTVVAKFSGKTYFESAEMDDETYDHFEKAFENGRFDPVIDKINTKNIGQNEALKEFLSKSGQTVEQFLDSDSYVPENLLRQSDVIQGPSEVVFNEEESIIVREAIQYAPLKCSENEATMIWRDVLGALKEASVSNIKLPPMQEEQKKSLEFWSKNSNAAGKLAQSVLARLV